MLLNDLSINLCSVEESFSDQMKDFLLLFISLILQVLQAIARATFYHINALSNICKITIIIKQVNGFHATKSEKLIFHQLHR